MSLFHYLHDKIITILFQVLGMLVLSFYLLAMGNTMLTVGTILFVWIAFGGGMLGLNYYHRNKHFYAIFNQMEQLEKPYLIHEFIEKTWHYEDHIYKHILRKSNKSALEAIARLEEEQDEYKSFIEAWIHEVKLPITSMYLMSDELPPDQTRKLRTYLSDLDNQVDQALFYARSEHVYQDYLIREVSLNEVIRELVKKNKYLLIQNQMTVSIECEDTVLTDSKWIGFIINQLIINAVKYKKEGAGLIQFTTASAKDYTRIMIKDDGVGIKDDELSRIFNKGFTGTNGRNISKSTGFGLYLCKRLCGKLGLSIQIYSRQDEYTEIIITFPKNSYITDL